MIRRVVDRVLESNALIYTLLLGVCSIIIMGIAIFGNKLQNSEFLEGVLVESFGMLFDILVLGVVFSVLFKFTEKRRDIKRYLEEIDDFRGWNEPEAMYRITGIIRRLDKLGVKGSELKLNNCYLSPSDLSHKNLSGADLEYAILIGANLAWTELVGANLDCSNLKGANLENTNLKNSILLGANLQGANLVHANLEGANLGSANLSGTLLEEASLKRACLSDADLSNANLIKADMEGAKMEKSHLILTDLRWANLAGANLDGADLLNANLSEANLDKATGLTIGQLSEAFALYQVKGLPPELEAEIRERKPELFVDSIHVVITPRATDTLGQKKTSTQCKGKTKRGEQCKRLTTDSSGYCGVHRKR